LRQFLTVVVRHGDNGQDEVDKVERAEKDYKDEKEYVIQSVSSNNLTHVHTQWVRSHCISNKTSVKIY